MTKQEFQKERTRIISEMLDNPNNGIYPTTECFNQLDELYERIQSEAIADYEAEKTVIKAKALRKKGTDKWYYWSGDGKNYNIDVVPEVLNNYQVSQISDNDIPSDAILIDIAIVIPPYQPEGNNLKL